MKREGEGSNKRTKKQKSAIPEEDVMKQGMEFFETKWARIQKYITELTNALQGDITELNNVLDVLKDKEACVTDTIYELCKKAPPPDFAEELYSKYEEVLTEYARDRVLPSIKEKNGEDMLRVLVKSRSRYKILVEWLSSRFSFLGRNYIPVRKCSTLNQVAQTCFYDLVYKEVKINAREPVFVLITKERDGEKIDRLLLKNVIDIYVEMKSYAIDFEEIMLRNTGAYYSRNAKDWIREDSWPEYMLRVEACLQEERERVSAYLHLTKEQKLVMVVEDKLLKNYAKQLLEKLGEENSGCWELFRDDKLEDLSRMYRLYSKIPKGLESVSAIFKQHITDEGTALVQQAADPASNQEQVLIQEIIELNNKFMVHVVDCFQGHNLFYKAIKEAFEKFCNKTVGGSCIAELLATFCHNILRKKDEKKGESENVSDEAIEETFKKVMKWLGYIKDKCLFAEFCRKNLADRLLFNRSAKIEHERSILRELKQKYGGRFTSKMEGMITDFTVSKHNHTEFENYLGNNPNALPGIDLSVNVLSGCWPSYKTSAINLPPEMVKCAEVFKGFYDENYQRRRKLTWIYSMGSCHLNGMFEQKNIELIVSTYQAALLLLFDTSDKLSYSEIQTQLNLTHDDTDGLLHSLSCDKYKILTKEPNTKTVSRTDYFEFNHKFTHKRERIKIPLPPVDETKTIVEDVDKDRRYDDIDQLIVGIMMSHKVLDQQKLVSECIAQWSRTFKPDIEVINRRIKALIARDYKETRTIQI